jgi:hypothetical protein
MNSTLILCFILLLSLTPQLTLGLTSGGSMEKFQAYLRGFCLALGLDCDVSIASSCWNETSASAYLTFLSQEAAAVTSSTPDQTLAAEKNFLARQDQEQLALMKEGLQCEKNLPYMKLMSEKLEFDMSDLEGRRAAGLDYVLAEPENTFYLFKTITRFIEQEDYEAVGMMRANFLQQIFNFRHKRNCFLRRAWNDRATFFRSSCQAMGVKCPFDSLSCWTDEASAAYIEFAYEWMKLVSKLPISGEDPSEKSRKWWSERGEMMLSRIPASVLECDMKSEDLKLIAEKTGNVMWSMEWFNAFLEYPKEHPEFFRLTNRAMYLLIDKNDYEAAGTIIGLEWYHVCQWKNQKMRKNIIVDEDL